MVALFSSLLVWLSNQNTQWKYDKSKINLMKKLINLFLYSFGTCSSTSAWGSVCNSSWNWRISDMLASRIASSRRRCLSCSSWWIRIGHCLALRIVHVGTSKFVVTFDLINKLTIRVSHPNDCLKKWFFFQARNMWAQLSAEQKNNYGEEYFERALRSLEKYTEKVSYPFQLNSREF